MKNRRRVIWYAGLCICIGLSGGLLVAFHAGTSPGLVLGFVSMAFAILGLSALSLLLWTEKPIDQQCGPCIQKETDGKEPDSGIAVAMDSLRRSLESFVSESQRYRSRLDDRIDEIEAGFEKIRILQNEPCRQGDMPRPRMSLDLTDHKSNPVVGTVEGPNRNADEIFRIWWLAYEKKVNQFMGNNSEGPTIFNGIEKKLSDALIEFKSAGRFMASSLLSIALKETGFSGHFILIPILYFPVPYKFSRFFEGERDRPTAIVRPALIQVERSEEDARLVARGVLR